MLDTGSLILDAGYWILDTGSLILDAGYWILDTGFGMRDFGLIVGAGLSARPINKLYLL